VSWDTAVKNASEKIRQNTRICVNPKLRRRFKETHGLAGPLIISLTTYGNRALNIGRVLQSVLRQSVSFDLLVLTVSKETSRYFDVQALHRIDHRIQLLLMPEDLGPHSKLLPCAQAFPDSYIATIDDDVIYNRDWLKKLVEGMLEFPGTVQGHRGLLLKRRDLLEGSPYLQWPSVEGPTEPSSEIFLTGHGGILYPSRIFPEKIFESRTFRTLAPKADDIWFHLVLRFWGAQFRVVLGNKSTPKRHETINNLELFYENVHGGGNDRQLVAVRDHLLSLGRSDSF
jgi:glycosyltransferase involved in cell wall biosynthesis